MIVRFRHFKDKEYIMQHRHWLKNTGIYIEDHFCAETMKKRSSLIPILKEMKKLEPRTQLRGDKITYRGRLYNNANIHELPIDAHSATTKTKDDVTLFSGRFSRLSNLNLVCLEIDLTVENGRAWSTTTSFRRPFMLETRRLPGLLLSPRTQWK